MSRVKAQKAKLEARIKYWESTKGVGPCHKHIHTKPGSEKK